MGKVTVGVAFYNSEATLADTIRSVFAQSFKDWELILVDDGSSDASLDIACSIRDPRVKVFSDGVNRGLASRLNQITGMAGGKYLARMDADDIMHPVRLQKQVEYLEAHPEVDVVDSEAYIIDALGNLTGIKLLPQINPDPYSAYKYCLMFHPTVMGRSAWFVDNPYDESFIRAEDYELWCRTCKSSSFARLKQPLHFYRENHRTSRAYLDDYVQGSRSYRKCLLLHGPRMIGWRHTTYLLMRSFCKTEIFRMVTVLGRQNLLISRRSLSLGEQERAKACCELRVSLETSVAGMKQES